MVGSVFRCASVIADSGFVALEETFVEHDAPFFHAASANGSVLVADSRRLFDFDGAALVERDEDPGDRITGLAADEESWIVVTSDAVLALPF